jgi:hypothetical protein
VSSSSSHAGSLWLALDINALSDVNFGVGRIWRTSDNAVNKP